MCMSEYAWIELKHTHLRPSNIRRDEKLNIPMPKDSQHHSPEIPLGKAAPTFEQLCSCLFLSLFIFRPCVAAVAACIHMLHVLVLLPAFVRE